MPDLANPETIVINGVSHPKWAFDQGRQAGAENKTTEKSLMALGLSCAASDLDARNTRGWLAGFDAGQADRTQLAASSKRSAEQDFFRNPRK